jgi:hypothetical protein
MLALLCHVSFSTSATFSSCSSSLIRSTILISTYIFRGLGSATIEFDLILERLCLGDFDYYCYFEVDLVSTTLSTESLQHSLFFKDCERFDLVLGGFTQLSTGSPYSTYRLYYLEISFC